ncbi:hypothetical protein ACOCG7_34070 (plasmid) [Paraburkholderia sp. DD10]|uniref:hypothetical protein n=1 Tax=Paraburkholderia sp. DD10 TaxID=3409691 RepID=UPI003BA0BF05
MCLTGAFVIPMVLEPGVRAGVISQPAIPVAARYVLTGSGQGQWMSDMNISDADLQAAAQRCARDHVPILIQRFKTDRISTHGRVLRIAETFADNAVLHEYDDPGPKTHPQALLSYQYDDVPKDVAIQRASHSRESPRFCWRTWRRATR